MASKRHQRRKQCGDKIKHRSAAAAQAHAATLWKKDPANVNKVWPYLCKHCSYWHVGHPPKEVRQDPSIQQQRGRHGR